MVRMTVLASGSKGNSSIVASSRTRILVDAGLSCREIFKRMRMAGEEIENLDAILITHEHQDHVQGLAVTARKLGIPVYFTEATHRAWMRWMTPRRRMTYADWLEQQKQAAAAGKEPVSADEEAQAAAQEEMQEEMQAAAQDESQAAAEMQTPHFVPKAGRSVGHPAVAQEPGQRSQELGRNKAEKDACALPGVEYFAAGQHFSIGDIAITPFTIPHDAVDPVGFVFEAEGVRIGLATDLGYMPSNVHMHLKRCDILMLESNHDVDMLRDGPYPWSVKQRVMSRVGHLSNDAAAEFLEKTYDGQAAYVVLAHLSESNNLPELAKVCAERALRDRMSLLANKLLLAVQHTPLEPIVL
jgi:phosphoribosyl 1,2-cyclic phosphodiesterase